MGWLSRNAARTIATTYSLISRGGRWTSVLAMIAGASIWRLLSAIPFCPTLWPDAVILVRLPGFHGYLRFLSTDIFLFQELWIDRVYDIHPDVKPKPDWTVVELGGHIGMYAILLGRTVDPGRGGRVLTLECDPGSYRILERNIAANRMEDRVFPFQAAAFSHRGEGAFISTTRTIDSHLEGFGNASAKSRLRLRHSSLGRIKLTTLDTIVEQERITTIDLLKINIEGAEFEALKGGTRKALGLTRRILLVHEADVPFSEITDFLGTYGFGLKESVGNIYYLSK